MMRTSNRLIPGLTLSALICLVLVAAPSFAGGKSWTQPDRAPAGEISAGEGRVFELARSPELRRMLEERATATAIRPDDPPTKGVAADPLGDTFGGGATQIDIVELSADLFLGIPVIFVTFSAAVSPGDSGAANAVVGFLDIDADQDGTTGDIPWTDIFNPAGPSSGMGNEFYVALGTYSSADDAADVVDDVTDTVVGRTPVLFGGNQMLILVDPLLIGFDDGAIDVATVLGTIPEPTDVAPNSGSVSSDTSILLRGRFRTSIEWRRTPNFPDFRPARVSDLNTEDSSNFYFLNPNNLEFLIKVINGCGSNNRFWVFFAGATDVEFIVTVEDIATGQTKQYFNPQGQPANAVTDNQAFATCP